MATADISTMTMEELAEWLKSRNIDDKTCKKLKGQETACFYAFLFDSYSTYICVAIVSLYVYLVTY